MLPPTVKGKPPLLRILREAAKRLLLIETQYQLDRLKQKPAGFVARAFGERNREIRAEGREWTEADVQNFVDQRLPAALEAAEAYAKEEHARDAAQ